MATRYVILPELRDYLPPRTEAEQKALEADIALRGNLDPIRVWPHDGHLVIVDGMGRHEACKKAGAPLKKPIVMDFPDIEAAKLWMIQNQFARRNLNDAQRGYLIGLRFNDEAPGQGARTDLGRGAGVAERLAAEFHMTDRAVRDCGRFAAAVITLTDTLGVDARAAILDKDVPFSREEIRTIAALPPDEHREVWERALKDRSSLKKILLAKTRGETKAERAEQVKHPPVARTAAMERYDLADLVRLISTNWGISMIEAYEGSWTQQNTLQDHLGNALRSLIRLSELNGWGDEALEDYRVGLETPEEDEPLEDEIVLSMASETPAVPVALTVAAMRAASTGQQGAVQCAAVPVALTVAAMRTASTGQQGAVQCAAEGCAATRPPTPGRKPRNWYCPDHAPAGL